VADARALGVAHGDLGAHRLWRRGDRIWVEGYGVPWREGATPEADARALAADLLAIAGTALGPAMRERLAAVRDGAEPSSAATPSGPRAEIAAPAPPAPPAAAPAPAAPPPEDAAPAPAAHPPPKPRPPRPPRTPPPPPPSHSPHPPRTPPPKQPLHPPRRRRSPRGAGGAARRPGSAPGATLRLGARRGWQRALRDAREAGRAAARAAAGGGRLPSGVTVSRVVGHVVDVRIEPAGLPPVSLVVVESPPGSRLPPGAVVGSVPSKVLLDRDGVWRFQARFGGTTSRTVVLVAPDEAVLVVPFPPPPPATAP
jgi:hypothetical protein